MQLEFHPLANLFPLVEGAEFDDLVADVARHGLNQAIDIYQGKILDGRNRYRAACAANVEIEARNVRYFRVEMHGDPLDYVLSQNLRRRHLNESQRALVGAQIANLAPGRPAETAQNCAVSQEAAAGRVNVSRRLVQSAAVVRAEATPEIVRAVERGKLSISAAAMAARLRPDRQAQVAERAEAGDARAARTVIKQGRRETREAELGAVQRDLPNKRYGLILADPEWRFEPRSRDTGMDRAADNHYPTSPTADIAARPVATIAAPDCVLALWATAPMLPDALQVMAAWGFTYKTHCIWHKLRPGRGRGSGYWFTGEHELLLIGTRGSIPAPATALCGSVLAFPVEEHSAKPEQFAALLEAAFPTLPKIELNRRGTARPGWDAWGNEVVPSSAGHDAQVIAPHVPPESPLLNQPALADDEIPKIPPPQDSGGRMSVPLCYLATPYTNYPGGLERAFEDAAELTGFLLLAGITTYSPIAHTHPVAIHAGIDPKDHATWLAFDEAMMHRCDVLLVAHMNGWRESKGIAHEIAFFKRAGKPIFDLDPQSLSMVRRGTPVNGEAIIDDLAHGKEAREQGGASA